MQSATSIAISLIQKWEGCRLLAYRPLPTDKWTVGWGATGPDITEGTRWTQEQADADLANRVSLLVSEVSNLITYGVFSYELGACVSLAYNIGVDAFKDSTLLKMLNKGDLEGAAEQFPRWDRSGGKVVPGLLNRREDEKNVFLGKS